MCTSNDTCSSFSQEIMTTHKFWIYNFEIIQGALDFKGN